MPGDEFRPQQSVLLWTCGVVGAIGVVDVARCGVSDGFSEMCVLIQQSLCSCFELTAAIHHLGGAAHGETRRDGVEVAALAVVALDQPLRLLVEVIRGDDRFVGGEAVDAGQAGDHAQVAPRRLVEEHLGRDRAAGRERQAGRRAPGEQGIEEVLGGRRGVVTVAVLQLFGEDPGLQPVQ